MKTTYEKIRAAGIGGTVGAVLRRIRPRRLACCRQVTELTDGKYGLEIGGPSGIFGRRGPLPIYASAALMDNCTYGNRTIWEGDVEAGNFCFDSRKSPGKQYILEASDLTGIASATYDFVASSHVLEHVANPLLALSEWLRVLKSGGLFILILPHKDNTFDHKRPVTSLEHVIADFDQGVTEADATHVEEILQLHDLALDPESGGREAFVKRSMKNFENRCFHHHVFDKLFALELVDHVGLQILSVELFRPFHIVIAAQKPLPHAKVQNEEFLSRREPVHREEP